MELREVTYLAVFLRIFAAVIVGGILGIERGMKNRPAGLRTYMLVCVGACVIMMTNQFIYQLAGTGDPVRMGAQVVSGIGFLGAGTIIVTRRNQIKGLTTAAGLWSAAGVGLALGVGFYEAAFAGTLAVFVVMTLLQKMDNKLHRKSKQLEAYIELKEISLGDFLRTMRESDIDISDVQREYGEEDSDSVRAYVATLKGKHRQNHQELMEKVLAIPGVVFVEEL
ncbi:MAG: MgtC/SapB family protein [Oscillospiraceae bacterium]|nr:MgtC/SapB family protein [Oscillospiraceae bacterium]